MANLQNKAVIFWQKLYFVESQRNEQVIFIREDGGIQPPPPRSLCIRKVLRVLELKACQFTETKFDVKELQTKGFIEESRS